MLSFLGMKFVDMKIKRKEQLICLLNYLKGKIINFYLKNKERKDA